MPTGYKRVATFKQGRKVRNLTVRRYYSQDGAGLSWFFVRNEKDEKIGFILRDTAKDGSEDITTDSFNSNGTRHPFLSKNFTNLPDAFAHIVANEGCQ